MQQLRQAIAKAGQEMPDPDELWWFIEERTDVADWLHNHGWEVGVIEAHHLMKRYHRSAPLDVENSTPRSVFIDAQLPPYSPDC